MNKKYTSFNSILTLVFALLLGVGTIWAEGSKDLYPVNAKGGRGYLRASTTESPVYPYPTLGTHYVYAEEGEQIALASNAQNGIRNYILLYGPNGREVTPRLGAATYDHGNIWGRKQELAGPRLPGQAYGEDRYMPIFYTVPAGGSGVYRVEFIGTENKKEGNILNYKYAEATTWPSNASSNFLIAWDISVAKKTNNTWGWVNGRVFMTSMTMNDPAYDTSHLFIANGGFYGTFKILTKDGYVYNVDNNGSQGIAFTFMVNNQGFHQEGDPTKPSYESIPSTTVQDVHSRYHDPRKADTDLVVTQKIFYNLPDTRMPEKTVAAMDGGETWLKVPEKVLDVTEIRVESAEGGVEGQAGSGAYIKFRNETGGEYTITIKPIEGTNFRTRILQGICTVGENKIYWDGKDGDGKIIPAGHVDLSVDLELHGAEVHFPYIDMELNENGIIIELLSLDTRSVRSDRVYWDDTSIGIGGGNLGTKSNPRNASHTVIPEGISSRVNGHIWGNGTDATSGTFGDNHGVDTWTFIQGDAVSVRFDVEVKVADLEVVSVVANKEVIRTDEEITYTVKVKNNGPNDVENATFFFQIPAGFVPVQASFTGGTCGNQSQVLAFDDAKKSYIGQLNLANQCEVTYTIKLKAVNPEVGAVNVEAAILRPKDIVDPDATNQEEGVLPTDPHYECEHNGLDTPCNNIKLNTAVIYTAPAFRLSKDGVFNDLNNDGFAQVGETITYTLKVANTGKTPLKEIEVSDPLLGGLITVEPVKSKESATLDADEIWTYTVVYSITQQDIAKKGVYNQAVVKGKDFFTEEILEITSVPTILLQPNDPGYDVNRPNHTYVPLKVSTNMISNPMVRQRMK